MNDFYRHRCIYEVLDGLREGLCHFSPPSRTALIFAAGPDDPLCIHDPQNLLRGHEPKLKELYVDSDRWRQEALQRTDSRLVEPLRSEEYEEPLTGLITFAGRSTSFFFQAWFTEHHPDMCSTGPTACWLEYAARLLSRNIAAETLVNVGTSGYVLQEYATHAVRDFIVDQRNVKIGWDTHLRVFPILDAVLAVSETPEEGAWPHGRLVFIDPMFLSRVEYLARFPDQERPSLVNIKHVRKLLQAVENSARVLVSDGRSIIGIAADSLPPASIMVEFCGRHGFLRLDEDPICSFSDGRYHSTNRRANLVQIEEALLETSLDSATSHILYKIISHLVHQAGLQEFGCTLIIDFNSKPVSISGHSLERPLDLMDDNLLDLAAAMAKVDGALHIGSDLQLHAFACLLDGRTVVGESRARGARFNSALRFTAEHPDILAVVVSRDRPVSVIQSGIEMTAQCEWRPLSATAARPRLLEEWLAG